MSKAKIYALTPEGERLKNELKELFRLRRLLKAKQDQINEARQNISVGQTLGGTPTQGGIKTSPQEKFIERIERLVEAYNDLMEQLFKAEDDFAEAIKDLSATEQSILIDRYINGKTWRVISIQYHYGKNQPKRIENQALNNLAGKRKC